jgi:type VI secretion system protein ImpH
VNSKASAPHSKTSQVAPVPASKTEKSCTVSAALNELYDQPAQQDFLGLCRTLEAGIDERPRIGASLTRREDLARFGQDPYFAFAASSIARATPDKDGVPNIIVRFLGLLGPQGAMPLGVTEEALHYIQARDEAFARFLDLLNNRFIQLFFRAWADPRPVTHRDRSQEEDRFLTYLGVNLGLGSPIFRNQDHVDDLVKIAFAGLMGAKTRSVSRLSAALSQIFGVTVALEEFVGQRLIIDEEQCSRLGGNYATLGRDILLGAGIYSVQDKFRFQIFVNSLADFETFLPSGEHSRTFAAVVAFFLGLELEWDVELMLPAGQARGMVLGQSGRLGWTSWLTPNWALETNRYRGDARFNLMERHLASTRSSPQ